MQLQLDYNDYQDALNHARCTTGIVKFCRNKPLYGVGHINFIKPYGVVIAVTLGVLRTNNGRTTGSKIRVLITMRGAPAGILY